MTTRGKPPKNGRKAFKGLAPKGYLIRMMEPGEVPALLDIARNADGLPPAASSAPDGRIPTDAFPTTDIHTFTRYLLSHEVFVAIQKERALPVGFATAAAENDLYWISRLFVARSEDDQIAGAILGAVADRAHWFFYRALAVSVPVSRPHDPTFYEKRGFLKIPHADLPDWLDQKRRAEARPDQVEDQIVMLKWL